MSLLATLKNSTKNAQSKKEGIYFLLTSGFFDGIGSTITNRLMERFGPQTDEAIITSEPDAKAILGKHFDTVCDYFIEYEKYLPLHFWLAASGATAGVIKNATTWAKYENKKTPSELLSQWQSDPYTLTEATGIGFASADKIALKIGITPTSDQRLVAAGKESIKKACEDAGGGAYTRDIERILQKLITSNQAVSESDSPALATRSLSLCTEKGLLKLTKLATGQDVYFSEQLYYAEEVCAAKLLLKGEQTSKLASPSEIQINRIQSEIGLTLNSDQLKAINTAFSAQVAIICGKPGAGKTTLLKVLAPVLIAQGPGIHFAAPTGKAAKRMEQALGQPCQTIHRLLAMQDLQTAKAVVLDESSMIDALLMERVLKAIGKDTSLILLGDPDQLPSVGPGKILFDLIQSQQVPTCMLTKVMRQADCSNINTVAQAFAKGLAPDFYNKNDDCIMLPDTDMPQIISRIQKIVQSTLRQKYDPLKEVQILVPGRKGPSGSDSLNPQLQAFLNPPDSTKKELNVPAAFSTDPATLFREGDKVMQLTNDYDRPIKNGTKINVPALANNNQLNSSYPPPITPDQTKGVFNGDVGYVSRINPANKTITVAFDNGEAEYSLKDAQKSLDHAYCCTVHKFQGSEAPVIFFVAHQSVSYLLRNRNLIYTAITRAKNKCIVMGSTKFIQDAVKVDSLAKRHTRLAGLLSGDLSLDSPSAQVLSISERKVLKKILDKNLSQNLETTELVQKKRVARI